MRTSRDAAPAGMLRHAFRSMGTVVSLTAPGAGAGAANELHPRLSPFGRVIGRVERLFADVERRFTRFHPDSELSVVNRRAGRWTAVSPSFGALLRVALDGADRTGGLFDPTILPALVAAGYDRDFADVLAAPPPSGSSVPPPCGGWTDVELRANRVRFPAGVGLDFGGLAKGWAVDLAWREVAGILPWVMISAGGDLRLAGHADGGLDIEVDDVLARPGSGDRRGQGSTMGLRIEEGALATSSVTCRAWGPGLHHIIDPRTSRPSDGGVVQATVWAETCTDAEILSKWALLTGPPALEEIPGLLVLNDGSLLTSMEPDEPGRFLEQTA